MPGRDAYATSKQCILAAAMVCGRDVGKLLAGKPAMQFCAPGNSGPPWSRPGAWDGTIPHQLEAGTLPFQSPDFQAVGDGVSIFGRAIALLAQPRQRLSVLYLQLCFRPRSTQTSRALLRRLPLLVPLLILRPASPPADSQSRITPSSNQEKSRARPADRRAEFELFRQQH
jgi:hypothetical protein